MKTRVLKTPTFKLKPFRELLEKRLTKEEIAEIEKSAQDERELLMKTKLPKSYEKVEKAYDKKEEKMEKEHEKFHDKAMIKAIKGKKKKGCK